jgi:uncharacterized protein YutE (UPF0331/DUF86 family)
MIDVDAMRYRLDLILDYLQEIQPLTMLSLDEFLADTYKKRGAERLLEITIQAALDINNHLLKEHFRVVKTTNSDGFLEMGQLGPLTPELAQEINKSGSFRNRLAHRYDKVDPEVVFQFIPKLIDQFSQYVEQISDFLNVLEDSNE